MDFPDNMPPSEKVRITLVADKVRAGMFSALSDYCCKPTPNIEQAEAVFIERAEREAIAAGATVLDVDTKLLGEVVIHFELEGHHFQVMLQLKMAN